MICELCGIESNLYDYIYKNEEDKYVLRLSAG